MSVPPRGRTRLRPKSAERLDQRDTGIGTAACNIRGRAFVGERRALRNGDFEIADGARLVASERYLECMLR